MRVFLTGATGFIGSRIIGELTEAGHQVIGLARTEAAEQYLHQRGALAHKGSLEHPETLTAGASLADAVIHCAFDHNFEKFAENCEKEREAIKALGAGLQGTDRPLIITSGTGTGDAGDGLPARESVFNSDHPNPRIVSELEGTKLLARGVDVRVVRLPQVHDTTRQGLLSPYAAICIQQGKVACANNGSNRWPAVHVSDAARLYALVLKSGQKGQRYNAVAEEGVTSDLITQALSQGLNLPRVFISGDELQAFFGWMSMFADKDMPASGTWTQQQLDWKPRGPGLIEDLSNMDYRLFKGETVS
ncbi:SDR family oxidoreductase [Tatumella citrea]|uniref:NAD-dependent dehydratase n=1 Tax=Tatumella citrea TaxID=53336 RepID=A0A1Y0LM51_TATCI|nr:SDR family oxidoreductase [Tatumella citrea]ARU94989.1 NAD-dependent dehydratase [Tatumella citrea]ARU99027.1 NAD-dependent dehydratase [Tatumella citrea]